MSTSLELDGKSNRRGNDSKVTSHRRSKSALLLTPAVGAATWDTYRQPFGPCPSRLACLHSRSSLHARSPHRLRYMPFSSSASGTRKSQAGAPATPLISDMASLWTLSPRDPCPRA
jgi:hypothetical protein